MISSLKLSHPHLRRTTSNPRRPDSFCTAPSTFTIGLTHLSSNVKQNKQTNRQNIFSWCNFFFFLDSEGQNTHIGILGNRNHYLSYAILGIKLLHQLPWIGWCNLYCYYFFSLWFWGSEDLNLRPYPPMWKESLLDQLSLNINKTVLMLKK